MHVVGMGKHNWKYVIGKGNVEHNFEHNRQNYGTVLQSKLGNFKSIIGSCLACIIFVVNSSMDYYQINDNFTIIIVT